MLPRGVVRGAGAVYHLTDRASIRAGVHRGFVPVAPTSAGDVHPEASINYEAGARWRSEPVNADVLGFYSDYSNLMGTLNSAITAFYNDLRNQGLLDSTMILQFSEFGRRIGENGSFGTDHGAAASMMAVGGLVRGGVYGTAPNLNPAGNGGGTLENNGNDVTYETDFRSVYAQVIDNWLGANSAAILNGNFRTPLVNFI